MLSNPSSSVREDGPDRLVCHTRSAGLVVLLRVSAAVAVVFGLVAVFLAATGAASPAILAGATVSVAGGLALGFFAHRRARITGTFVVDRGSRVIRRAGAWGDWRFEDVVALRLVIDPTDGMRPDCSPRCPTGSSRRRAEETR